MTRNSNILKSFTIYRSSAGSGKTRTLAKEYLKLALQRRVYNFRHILAVTFANKATQEMKDRILDYLNKFAKGENDLLADELKKELNLDDPTFRQNCAELQSEILHHYDQFSISTIDAFFQKVIRSFTRESGLIGDYRLEVDQDVVLEEVIKNLIDELGNNPELTRWVVEFARENMENDKAWDVRNSLIEFANEIFREEFKAIEEQVRKGSADPDFFKNLRAELLKVKNSFLNTVSQPAKEVLDVIRSKGWDYSDFKYGSNSGIRGFLEQFAWNKDLSSYEAPKTRVRNEYLASKNWPGKNLAIAADISNTAEQTFVPRFEIIIDHYDKSFRKALSAEVALKNMYVFALLSDIARKLQDYKAENNVMLLADAPKLLNGIIQDSDTPFIYEKIGSFYRNYLIDEFQDTSGFQWKNFLPLLTNGLDQGYASLIVGDVKQAIYRWRNGDLTLLQNQVEENIGKNRVEIKELDTNFRSAKNIIQFNNALFNTAATIVAESTQSPLAALVYRDVTQQESKSEEGFVRINFLKDEKDFKWKAQALDQIPHHLEMLQKQGVALSDIAILVRYNNEGQEIAAHLMEYENSGKGMAGCKYDVVSNESLRLDGSSSVNLLLGALRYLLNPEDPIARAQLSFEYAKLQKSSLDNVDVFAVTNQVFFESQLPDRFTKEKMSLKKLPLLELTETLVEIFNLGKERGELAYLIAFQDLVLEFSNREWNDIAAFLEWWGENKDKERTSIKISGEVPAVKILSIHKSKGLQFKYVLVPFCAWSIDHSGNKSPNLWVKSDEEPFSGAGYLPVKYTRKLDETYFQEAYQQEHIAAFLDNLNLLYVALSRAEIGMIITTTTSSSWTGTTVGKWIYESIQKNETLNPYWKESRQEFIKGDWSLKVKVETYETAEAIQLTGYASSRWRDRLVIRQAGTTFFEQPLTDQRDKINYGIHLHAFLSRIQYADDISRVMENLIHEGLIQEQEREAVQTQLDGLMAHPLVGRWFEKGWEVRTEVPILLPGGAENRIDRLLINGDKAIVIDFKTGVKSKADQNQVMEYMQILKKMDFKNVEGYLLYTRDQEVISLTEGKGKLVKKKSENQLGLDF